MSAVTSSDTLYERFIIITWFTLVIEHFINTRLIQCHRVKTCKDTHVMKFWLSRISVAVTIH